MAETERTGLLRRILGGQQGRTEPGLGGYGYNDASGNRVGALRDMLDGGGVGQSGPTFQGGPLSGLLNAIRVRPMGYEERLGSVHPQVRPQMSSPAAAAYSAPAAYTPPAAPAYTMHSAMGTPFQRQPVVTPPVYSYPLDDPFGDMMMRLHQQGIPQPSAYTGYGPR